MVKAAELRIGNYVFTNSGEYQNEICRITAFGYLNKIQTINGDESYTSESSLNPIPLSEEILLKAGFEKSSYDLDKFGVSSKFEGVRGYQVIRLKGDWIFRMVGFSITKIPYLHNLQNIYYEIEGEELSITL